VTHEARPQRRTLLRPSEVALIFRVAPRTVARWADSGRLTVVRTPGGHRRYPAEDVIDLLTLERREKPELPSGDEIDLTDGRLAEEAR
jgi:excisionase family DNA binding protein